MTYLNLENINVLYIEWHIFIFLLKFIKIIYHLKINNIFIKGQNKHLISRILDYVDRNVSKLLKT